MSLRFREMKVGSRVFTNCPSCVNTRSASKDSNSSGSVEALCSQCHGSWLRWRHRPVHNMRLLSSFITKIQVGLWPPAICRSNFEIHRNGPVSLPHAIETRMKCFEATGSASAINPWAGYFLFCPRVCYCDSSHWKLYPAFCQSSRYVTRRIRH